LSSRGDSYIRLFQRADVGIFFVLWKAVRKKMGVFEADLILTKPIGIYIFKKPDQSFISAGRMKET
jgi:hypothetical protein